MLDAGTTTAKNIVPKMSNNKINFFIEYRPFYKHLVVII